MSKPDIVPKTSAAGIAVDPKTLERVIPESKRPDGSVRKQLRVRPGFTPQEDIGRFRGSRQQQHDRNQLPKGHILGWIAPSIETQKKRDSAGAGDVAAGGGAGEKPMTKSAAKNAKRKAKKQAEKEKAIREAWDEDSDEENEGAKSARTRTRTKSSDATSESKESEKSENAAADNSGGETKEAAAAAEGDALAEELEKKLDVH